MTTANWVTLIASGIAFLAAVFSAGVSVYNARLGRFASERWWERKAGAYTDVIGKLWELRTAANPIRLLLNWEGLLPSETAQMWRLEETKRFGEAIGALYEVELRGSLLLSAEAVGVLAELRTSVVQAFNDVKDRQSMRAVGESAMTGAEKAIASIRDIALKDLGLPQAPGRAKAA